MKNSLWLNIKLFVSIYIEIFVINWKITKIKCLLVYTFQFSIYWFDC